MCGIIGYIGHRPAVPILLEGLKRLEYRGYDSAGIAYIQQGKLKVIKSEGKISILEEKVFSNDPLHTTIGLGHTRWATHGVPNEKNAHPHMDLSGNICVVHNGIIENYTKIKESLKAKGIDFRSDTDTEVLVHLISEKYSRTQDPLTSIRYCLKQVQGSYAIGVMFSDRPKELWAAKHSSPLIVGIGVGENFIGSDVPAFLPYTKDVIFLEDGEIARLTTEHVDVYSLETGEKIKKQIKTIPWDVSLAQKGGYKHFMLKEIMEQPRVIFDALAGRVDYKTKRILLNELNDLGIPDKIHIVACGTSFHAGFWGKYLFESLAKIPVEVDIASEFRYRDPLIRKDDLVVVISQSGETADTLAGLRMAKEMESKVVGICNVVGSSVARESDKVLYTQAGPEISVASTKAMCSQMVVILLMALYFAEKKNLMEPDKYNQLIMGLKDLPNILEKELPKIRERAKELCVRYSFARSFFYLGRGLNYPLALEGSLKLKEISYIHAEGYAAGEMKHGPIALIDPEFPSFVIATKNHLFDKVVSNIKEIQARKGPIICLTNPDVKVPANHIWQVPDLGGILTSFLILPALQLFAYETAVYLGKDVDQPRNLAKSVTVE
ncbi:glutamine--fructose-6-phosphate transaminase (isomerizing) [Desulfothermus sp.]